MTIIKQFSKTTKASTVNAQKTFNRQGICEALLELAESDRNIMVLKIPDEPAITGLAARRASASPPKR